MNSAANPIHTESGGHFRWAAAVQLAQILGTAIGAISLVFLAWIAYLGGQVKESTVQVQEKLVEGKMVQDSIHVAVNSAKSKVDSLLGVERDYNQVLQAQIRKLGHEPSPPQPKQGGSP